MSEIEKFKCIGYMVGRSRVGGADYVRLSDFDRVTAERDAALLELSEIKESLAYRGSLLCRIEGQRDAMQQRLTAADERADEAVTLLGIWQTWLGAVRDSCDESGKLIWDRIDAVTAPKPAEDGGDE